MESAKIIGSGNGKYIYDESFTKVVKKRRKKNKIAKKKRKQNRNGK
jgi:hypothetical protein